MREFNSIFTCTYNIIITLYFYMIVYVFAYTQSLVIFAWLLTISRPVHSQQEDWRSSLKESGGLFVITNLGLWRLMLPVDNWATAQHCSMGTTLGMFNLCVPRFLSSLITPHWNYGAIQKAEICTILFLMRCPFKWYPFWQKLKFSVSGRKPWTIVRGFDRN